MGINPDPFYNKCTKKILKINKKNNERYQIESKYSDLTILRWRNMWISQIKF